MILVTGGTGLLGSHLLFRLSLEKEPIRAFYRDSKRIGQVRSLFLYYDRENGDELFSGIEWFQGDVLDLSSLEGAFQNVKTVYHCAGKVSFVKKHFNMLMKVNRKGTANIVNCCLEFGVDKLCHVSSTAAIGGQSHEITNEETKWKQSPKTSGYSISKYSSEKEVWRGVEEGLNCVIVNPSVIFGAGNWDESSLTIFRTVNKGLRFFTQGQNGFVDARDVADIMVRLTKSEVVNERYLCVGHNVPIEVLLKKIALQLGKNPPTINTPKWLAGASWRISWLTSRIRRKTATITKESAISAYSVMEYDNQKIISELSYTFHNLDETIQNTISGRLDK